MRSNANRRRTMARGAREQAPRDRCARRLAKKQAAAIGWAQAAEWSGEGENADASSGQI
jgi:hypothetical protein